MKYRDTSSHRRFGALSPLSPSSCVLILALLTLAACTPIQDATVIPPGASQQTAPADDAPSSAKVDHATAPLDMDIPPDPTVHKGQFANGLTYYIRANAKPEQRAELRLFVNAGSLMEDDDQQGLAHFVEHMAFNGTRHFAKQELVDYLELIGTRFGADLNAYTSFDETVYKLKIPTDDEEIVGTAFQILEDWAHGISFDDEEIDKERGVIVEEWRLGRGVGARLRDKQFPVMFKGSRYAERLPIGLPEIIENASYDTLRRFYRDWYRPDLMAVVAVGDFDVAEIKGLIEKHFAHLPNPESPRPRVSYPVPPHPETLFSINSDPELTATSASIFYKHPAQGDGTYGDYRRSLVQGLYHGMLNDRLAELTQQRDPPFLVASSTMGAFVRTATVFSQQVRVEDGKLPRGLSAVLQEVERVDRHGFTASELERAKINILRGYQQANLELDKLRSGPFADEYGRNFLTDEPIPGIPVELQMVERFLPSIGLDEVNRLAQQWIRDDNRVIVVNVPDKEDLPLPTEGELLALFDQVEDEELEPYVDRVRDEPLLAEIPEPGPVVAESFVEELGVTEWRLANGVHVILKPTDFRNDQILLSGFSPGGHSLIDDARYTSAIFATSILAESGLGAFDAVELEKALAGKVASAQSYIGEMEEGLSGFASPQDVETMFQLLYLQATAPRVDLEAYESLIAKLRVVLANRQSQPGTVYRDKLNEVLSGGHPRRQPITEAVLDAIDPQVALEVYRERFADASDFTFVIVGNFEPDTLRPWVETYLGGLPSTQRQETWKDIGVRPPSGVIEFSVEKGLEPKSQVQLIFTGDASWSREAQHEMGSLSRVLDIRLREVLREDLGATYGVSVGGRLSRRPYEGYSFSISFGCAPDEVDALVEAVFRELDDLKAEGVDEDKIHKVKESQRRRRETDVLENSFWLQALESYYDLGLDPRLLLEHEALLDSVTAKGLQDAANRYFDRQNYILAVLDPESQPVETDQRSQDGDVGETSDTEALSPPPQPAGAEDSADNAGR